MCSVQFGKRYFSIKTSVLLYSNKCTVTVCDLFNSDKCLKSNVGTWLVQFRHVYCSIQTRVLFNSDKFTVQFRQVYCSIQTSVLYCPLSSVQSEGRKSSSHLPSSIEFDPSCLQSLYYKVFFIKVGEFLFLRG